MNLIPFTPLDVTAFFTRHRWMAIHAAERADTLWSASGGNGFDECRRVAAVWMHAVDYYEPSAYSALMSPYAPLGSASSPAQVFQAWTRHQIGKFLGEVEDRVTLERFGVRIRSVGWPWRWKPTLTDEEMKKVSDRLRKDNKLDFPLWEAEKWQAAFLMAAAVYPERFSKARPGRAPSLARSGLHFRLRGVTEDGRYVVYRVLEGRGGKEAVLDLPDDGEFSGKIRKLLAEAAESLTPGEAGHPVLLTVVDPSERQMQILKEVIAETLGASPICLKILTPAPLAGGGTPRHVREWNGGRYAVSTAVLL